MSSPAIYSGTRSRLLTSLGLELSSGQTIDFSADPNLVKRPNDVSGWSTTGANGPTGANSTSTSDLPIEGIVNNCLKLTSTTAAGAEATNYFSYPITMPTAYLNRKHKIEFWMRPGTNFITSEWTVSIYAGSTRMGLGTDISGVSYLPAVSGKYTTTFDADSSTAYTVRFSRPVNAGGNAGVLNVSSVVVGPGIQATSAVVTAWTAFTPTFNDGAGSQAISNNGSWWRRVGESIEVQVDVSFAADATGTTTWNMAGGLTGITPDTSKFGARQNFGSALFLGGTNSFESALGFNGTNYQCRFVVADTGNVGNTNPTGEGGADTNDRLTFVASYPVLEWAGSGTMNVLQDDTLDEWRSYTPTFSAGFGTVSTHSIFRKRVGDDLFIQGYFLAGTVAASSGSITLPTGLTIDTTKIPSTSRAYLGEFDVALASGAGLISSTDREGTLFSDGSDTDEVFFSIRTSTTGYEKTNVSSIAGSGSYFMLNASIPIAEWRGRSGGGPVGFAMVSESAAGLMPAANTSLGNATATRFGFKQYLHGTTYNGGIAPTVTLASGGGTLSSVQRAIFIPYQMQGGEWRMKLNVVVTLSSTARTIPVIAIAGVTFKNTSGFNQNVSGAPSGIVAAQAYTQVNNGNIAMEYASGSYTLHYYSGDVELESKPTWAY